MLRQQVVVISAMATSFTAVCDACVELDSIAGWSGSTFAGRLDLDLRLGTFLCRRGHAIRVERETRRDGRLRLGRRMSNWTVPTPPPRSKR